MPKPQTSALALALAVVSRGINNSDRGARGTPEVAAVDALGRKVHSLTDAVTIDAIGRDRGSAEPKICDLQQAIAV
jgi:hypothetical protein